jgi:PAS domain-containing protein
MTIHLQDTKAAIERGNLSQIEDAFRALVGWPKEEEIVGADADARCSLLEEVCQALKRDDRQMPGDIVTIIEETRCKLRSGSYRHGAGAVLADLDHWRYLVGGEA